jgi:uncharacterized protein YukE
VSIAARELRARAERVRRLAHAMGASVIAGLCAAGGPEVWQGPTASAFGDEVTSATRTLTRSIDDLQRAAHLMVAEADRLEATERAAAAAAAVLSTVPLAVPTKTSRVI